jgi:8-oxo-dGTP pyrophosphatase MutT (NUDIX family)
MMSYEQWLKSILEVAGETASREFQEEAWLSGRPSTSSPRDIYIDLFDAYTFDLFHEMYSKDFTPQQSLAWNEFKQQLESYEEKWDEFPNERIVFEDPDWQLVREAAARFVSAFDQKTRDPSITGQ